MEWDNISPPLFIIKSKKPMILLISFSGGRFPQARLQSPRHFVPAGLSARAIPARVAAFHYNQLM
ncbi:hypothetical protein SAMN05518871_11615 [Psychrobacillus sp. OK028]|nr:hypothetical protein SAMN05518871_11615 [Psychrobacillus sp. OK028]